MNSLCLPSSVSKLCQVLSSLGIQGRFLSHQTLRVKQCTSSLPIATLHADNCKTRPNPASLKSTSLVCNAGKRPLIHPGFVSVVKQPNNQQKAYKTLNSDLQQITSNTSVDPLFRSSFKKLTKHQIIFQGRRDTGLEYVCPSNTNASRTIIVDQAIQNVIIDCPTLPQIIHEISLPELRINEISDPVPGSKDDANKTPPAKEARRILKIRRRKMNRHLLKKFKKRMEFTLRKQKLLMKKKKEAVFQARLDTIRRSGVEFDALQFIQQELEKARKGGFQIDIFPSKRQ